VVRYHHTKAEHGRGPVLLYPLTRVWRPAVYQGGSRRHGYFEGWYFRLLGSDGERALAVIPGISYPRGGEPSAFVQVITADGRVRYFEYAAEEFRFSQHRFGIEIGPNHFGEHGLSLDCAGADGAVVAEIGFGDWTPWPVTFLDPGIMGRYRFVPQMECYHGVLSMDHALSGIVAIDGEEVRYDGGRGYVEKDWGRSFPRAWGWAQCNSVATEGTALTFSVAHIPWLGSAFTGFIAGLRHDGVLHPFSTYNGARVTHLDVHEGEAAVTLATRDLELSVALSGAQPGALRSPVLGAMSGTAYESLGGRCEVRLQRLSDEGEATALFEGSSDHAAIELMDADGILASFLRT
jgi:tocopherol cyclase